MNYSYVCEVVDRRQREARCSGVASPWNDSFPEFKTWSHLSEPKSLSLQNLRTRLVVFDHVPFDWQSHGGKLTIYFDLLGS